MYFMSLSAHICKCAVGRIPLTFSIDSVIKCWLLLLLLCVPRRRELEISIYLARSDWLETSAVRYNTSASTHTYQRGTLGFAV